MHHEGPWSLRKGGQRKRRYRERTFRERVTILQEELGSREALRVWRRSTGGRERKSGGVPTILKGVLIVGGSVTIAFGGGITEGSGEKHENTAQKTGLET